MNCLSLNSNLIGVLFIFDELLNNYEKQPMSYSSKGDVDMFKNIIINDFRQFKNKELILGKRVTVLAGRNSTGKSTILGLLANSGELKKKDGITISGRQFRAEFGEILHGSKEYDSSGSNKITINVVDNENNLIDYRSFRTAWQKDANNKYRFRIIPLKNDKDGKKTEAKMEIPVIYLGLSRLYPIGEADVVNIQAKSVKFDSNDQKDWFIKKYCEILNLHENINSIDNYSIKETSKKSGVGIETDKYDYLTNSAGQDNVGQILLAILSFKRLKESITEWKGGFLLIDEVDATLHPAAQKKLFDLLCKEAKILDIQIAVTTHSSDLLKHVFSKTKKNDSSSNNEIELYYFTNANRIMDIKRNPDYSSIENDLLLVSVIQNTNKVKVYSEDEENRWFIRNLVPDLLHYVDMLDVHIGCSELLSLYTGDLAYFRNVVIVFDGDVPSDKIDNLTEKLKTKLNNIVKLPGDKRPEEILYDYIVSLPPEHSFWESASRVDMTWDYLEENGPTSKKYISKKERERYKNWFQDHQMVFESTKLFDFWKEDNKELVDSFRAGFIDAYNDVAERIFAKKIDNTNE